MSVIIKYTETGKWKENSYLIQYDDEAVLIDPGDEFENLENLFFNEKIKIKAILNTHGHFDHIGAVQELRLKYNLPFYLHSKDKRILNQANLLKKLTGDNEILKIPDIDYYLDSVKSLFILNKEIKIHHTPGHSPGSVCFEIDKALITGDIIFNDSIGRTDLPGGNEINLNETIKFIIVNFKNFIIYPGHGQPFILNEERIRHIKTLIKWD